MWMQGYMYKNVTATLFAREKSSLTNGSLNQILLPYNNILCGHLNVVGLYENTSLSGKEVVAGKYWMIFFGKVFI